VLKNGYNLEPYRMLDYDDLIILSLMNENYPQCKIATHLNVGAPAVCHRIRKYNDLWTGMVYRTPSGSKISPEFKPLVERMTKAALVLIDAPMDTKYSTIVEAVKKLRKENNR